MNQTCAFAVPALTLSSVARYLAISLNGDAAVCKGLYQGARCLALPGFPIASNRPIPIPVAAPGYSPREKPGSCAIRLAAKHHPGALAYAGIACFQRDEEGYRFGPVTGGDELAIAYLSHMHDLILGIHADGTGRIDDPDPERSRFHRPLPRLAIRQKRSAGYQQRPIYGLLHCELSNALPRTTLLRPQAKSGIL